MGFYLQMALGVNGFERRARCVPKALSHVTRVEDTNVDHKSLIEENLVRGSDAFLFFSFHDVRPTGTNNTQTFTY